MPKEQIYSWELDIPLSRQRLWKYVADTERINRLADQFSVSYSYVPQESGGSRIFGAAKALGIRFEWEEKPCEFVKPDYFQFTRDYSKGMFSHLVSKVELQETGQDRTHLRQTIKIMPRNALFALLTPIVVRNSIRKGFLRAYHNAVEWSDAGKGPVSGAETTRIRRHHRYSYAITKLRTYETIADTLSHLLLEFVFSQPESEVATLRPYALADMWNVSRHDVLTLFLHGTSAGLFDMHWNLICPSCRRSKMRFPSLAELSATGHCETCNINYTTDFERAVEVTFSPEPMGLGMTTAEYCHSGPMNTPHRLCSTLVPSNQDIQLSLKIEAGTYLLKSPQSKGSSYCEFVTGNTVTDEPATPITITEDGILNVPKQLQAGSANISLQNKSTVDAAEFYIDRAVWADDAATAADVTSRTEFRRLFSAEVLAPGMECSISNMTFLFSDLVGSTALYEHIGDAPAFSLVRDHFELLEFIYSKHRGSLVKTIGDAVMAVFRDPQDAVQAAISMQKEIGCLRYSDNNLPLNLCVGLHAGPCIAVRANDTLDYFGTTVNRAARLQSAANQNELLLSKSTYDLPGVSEAIAEHDMTVQQEKIQLKGIEEPFSICRLFWSDNRFQR